MEILVHSAKAKARNVKLKLNIFCTPDSFNNFCTNANFSFNCSRVNNDVYLNYWRESSHMMLNNHTPWPPGLYNRLFCTILGWWSIDARGKIREVPWALFSCEPTQLCDAGCMQSQTVGMVVKWCKLGCQSPHPTPTNKLFLWSLRVYLFVYLWSIETVRHLQ